MDANKIESVRQCPRCRKTYGGNDRFCGDDGARLVDPDARTQVSGVRSASRSHPLLIAGRYLKIRALGEGGQASVWLAQDIRTGRMLALKDFHVEMDEARCHAEVLAASRIEDHAHIVKVYDLDRDPGTGRLFMKMEYLHGETLEDRLARGPVGMRDSVAILQQVARGLAQMHKHGLIHRDVKPANIMLCNDDDLDAKGPRVKLLDLGVAKSVAPGTWQLTVAGAIVGTLDYAAPEQLRGEPASPGFDVYALGVVAHELWFGHLPREPGCCDRPIPTLLRVLLDQMLADNPSNRPARMADVCVSLERAQCRLAPEAEAPHRIPAPALAREQEPLDEASCGSLAVPKHAFMPRFAAAAAILLAAVGSLLSPVLGSEDPGAVAVRSELVDPTFEVDAITFDPGPLDYECRPTAHAREAC